MLRTILRLPVLLLLATGLRALDHAAPLPEAVTSFGAAVSGGRLFIYGGHTGERHVYTADKVSGALYALELRAGAAWESLPRSLAAQGTGLVAHGGKLYRAGGMAAQNLPGEKTNLRSLDSVARFDPATLSWEELPPLPAPRSSHDVAVIGDKFYVGGGWVLGGGMGSGRYHDTTAVLDLAARQPAWSEIPQPFQVRAHALAALGSRLFFLGGMTGSNQTTLAVEVLDTATGKWSSGPALPRGKLQGFGNSACVAGGRLYISGLSGEVHRLAADESGWETVAKLRQRRFFHRLIALDDATLLALGGEDEEGKIRDLEIVRLNGPADEAATADPSAIHHSPSTTPDWPQWRGPGRDGVAPAAGWNKQWPADGPARLWQAKAGLGMASPVIAAGRVILAGNQGGDQDTVSSHELLTGREVWRHTFASPTRAHEMPIVPNGPAATPAVIAGRVYTLSREGGLRVLDFATGQLAWSKHLVTDLGGKRPVYGYTQSPLVHSGLVFLDVGAASGEPGSTVALDAATGELRWRGGSGEAGYSSARAFTRDGEALVAMFKGEGLSVFRAADGRQVGFHPTTVRDFCNSLTPVFVGHRILVSNTGADPAALVDWTTDNKPAWTHADFAQLFNQAILHDGCLFAFNERKRNTGEFVCVDAVTGTTRWTSDAVGIGVFVLSDGHWLFLTRQGEVVLAPASRDELKPVARFQALGGKSYATPALADGILLIRNNDGDTSAYDLRAGTAGR